MKKRSSFKLIAHKILANDGIYIAILTLLVVFACFWCRDISEIIDWKFFSSIVLVVFIHAFANSIKHKLMNSLEDSAKLTTDYQKLVSRYQHSKAKMITYDNSNRKNSKKLKRALHLEGTVTFPVICDYKLHGCRLEIADSKEMYPLPDKVKENYDTLLSAHNTSTIFNQLNIRLDDWKMTGNILKIYTSRTTYFDSMVTNRAMDLTLPNGTTIRDYFGYGPFLPSLIESRLSNHIGFNGFVESADGYILFVKRRKDVSIAKGTYMNSVGASLKTKYALDDDGNFSLPLLLKGIKQEIKDELKIKEKDLEPFDEENHHLIAAYRDIVEGGKPQFLFYVKVNQEKDKIKENFKVKARLKKDEIDENLNENSKEDDRNMDVDGCRLEWIAKRELEDICIVPEGIVHKNRLYRMVPSSSACFAMLIEHLREIDRTSSESA